jgi:hypothetical protein
MVIIQKSLTAVDNLFDLLHQGIFLTLSILLLDDFGLILSIVCLRAQYIKLYDIGHTEVNNVGALSIISIVRVGT